MHECKLNSSPSRSRTWRLGLALLFALGANPAWSLGLGEIELDSALNEKLRAEIELIDAAGLEPAEILVSLASSEDFERVGVERFFFLTDLRFEVAVDNRGRPIIRVRSSQAVSEPYLNFIVEVLWPSGRLLKEFTLLLDPPTFTQAAAPSISAPARDTASATGGGRVERAEPTPRTAPVTIPQRSTASAPRATAPAPSQAPRQSAGDGEWLTTQSDTLWKIASETLPSESVSVEQNMMAIKRKNPRAFIRNNINLLKAGYVLRTPDTAEANELTDSQAKREVAMEHEAWRTGRALPSTDEQVVAEGPGADTDLKAQIDATEPAAEAAPTADADGQLRIIAGEGDSTQGAQDLAAAGQGTAASAEEADRLQREVDELNYKLEREAELAASQISVKERQLEVKDQQIAELQATVRQMREQLESAQTNPAQSQSAAAAPTPWWQSPWTLGAGMGAVALLLGWGLFARRRQADVATEPAYGDADETLDRTATAVTEPAVSAAGAVATAYDDEDDTRWAEDEIAEPVEETSSVELLDEELDEDEAMGQTGDVIGEADIYIAYGRYPQAISLLSGALEADADRHDVRVKLLELYAETNDAEAFEGEMLVLQERCEDEEYLAIASQFRERLEDAELDLDDLDDTVTDGVAPEPEAAADTAGLDSEFELEIDDSVLSDAGADDALDAVANEFDEPETSVDDDLSADGFAGADLDADPQADHDADDAADALADLDDMLDELPAGETDDAELDAELDALFDDIAEPSTETQMETLTEADADAVTAPAPVAVDADNTEQLGGDLGMDFDPEVDVAALDDVAAQADDNGTATDDLGDDEFDFSDTSDSASTKLDLARAYIDMGDEDGARDILSEVLEEGNDDQQRQANELLESI